MDEIEYKLKFLLNSLTLEVIDIKKISTPADVTKFNSENCNFKKIQGFCSEIQNTTTFPVMDVPIDRNETRHTVIFCEAVVGESLAVSSDYSSAIPLPAEYKSLITAELVDKEYFNNTDLDLSKFSYLINNKQNILPLYKIEFNYDEEFENRCRTKQICDRCSKMAIMFCPAERANFCDKCDQEVHNDDFLKRHKRIYFDTVGQKKFFSCHSHPKEVVDYYCDACEEIICVECKINGTHKDHPITSFLTACGSAKLKLNDSNKTVSTLQHAKLQEINEFKLKTKDFQENISNIRKYIEQEYKMINLKINNLESFERQKLNAKFIKKLYHFNSLKRIVEYSEAADPADLLKIYKNIKNHIEKEKNCPAENENIKKLNVSGKMDLDFKMNDITENINKRIENVSLASNPYKKI